MSIFRKNKDNKEKKEKKKRKKEPETEEMQFHVAGITFDNDDGVNRQDIMKKIAECARNSAYTGSLYNGLNDREIFEKGVAVPELTADTMFITIGKEYDDYYKDYEDTHLEVWIEPTVYDGKPADAVMTSFGQIGFVPADLVEEYDEKAARASHISVYGNLAGGNMKVYDPDAGKVVIKKDSYGMALRVTFFAK